MNVVIVVTRLDVGLDAEAGRRPDLVRHSLAGVRLLAITAHSAASTPLVGHMHAARQLGVFLAYDVVIVDMPEVGIATSSLSSPT